MFGGFKKLFSKEAPAPAATPAASPPPAAPVRPASPTAQPAAAAPAPDARRAPPRPVVPPGECVNVPFKSILARLPSNLATLVKSPASGNFPLPVATAVAQLQSGAVRVPFGDLRAAAPAGTFADNATLDETMVDLPLADVLPLINPALLPKRTGQKRVYVSEDVTSVFGKDKTPKASAQVTGPAIGVAPSPEPVAVPVPKAPEPAPAPIPMAPAAPIAMPTISMPKPAAPAPAPRPAAPSIPIQPAPKPAAPAAAPLPSFAPKPAAPAPVAAKPAAPAPVAAAPAPATGDLTVPVASVYEAWPPALRQEVDNAGLKTANLVIPMQLVEPAMRGGRITFPWSSVSQWMQPAPAFSFAPETVVELSLKVIIPLFMSQRKGGGSVQKKVAVDEQIPDVFGGNRGKAPEPAAPAPAPAPAPIAMPTPAPAPEPAPIAMPTISLPKPAAAPIPVPVPKPVDDGSAVLAQLESTAWSPKDVVHAICGLKGVAGSLIATADGLSIADQLPQELNPENVAAFLPQIFGRVGQYTKELHLGTLSSATLVVGDAPCTIYKTGGIYLVVLGQVKASLPEGTLNRIATELAKRNP